MLAVTGIAVAGLPACGEESDYANAERPPAPVSVTGAASTERVSISPTSIGAGPLRLTVANISERSLDVALEPVQEGGPPASSGPINPGGTATIAVEAQQGRYEVRARGTDAQPAVLSVGAPRRSAQDDLLLP